jgi:serine phosphatase RsbU (regulator of sigma subunit)
MAVRPRFLPLRRGVDIAIQLYIEYIYNMNGLLLHLDPQSPEPLPQQIARQFREKILRGEINDQDRCPPSAALAREYRVSVSTVQQAYKHLEREGLVEAREGSSPTVALVSEEQRRELARRRLLESLQQQELSLKELELARKIQLRLMPPSRVQGDGFRVVSRCLPARFVAGDFYDVIPHADGSLGVVVADVAGKGIGASLIMASVKAMLPFVAAERSVDETLRELNRRLHQSLGRREFVALAYARFSPAERRVTLANAGVPDPLLLRAGGVVEGLEISGPRLPLGAWPDVAYEAVVCELSPGEALLMYSDGLPEARQLPGEQLGYEGFVDLLCRARAEVGSAKPTEDWLDEMLELLQQATVPVAEDDWTAVVIEHREAGREAEA